MAQLSNQGANLDAGIEGLSPASLRAALNDWRLALGTEAVLERDAATTQFGPCTLRGRRSVVAAVRPASTEQVVAVITTARHYKIPLYPISTGHNWGYGSANPVRKECVVVDLSRMNRIAEMNTELGIVTVEPGVTQGQLYEFLERQHLQFLVPVHGGGPSCSLVGNALERGYGITPYADHFGAVTSLEAVLPDGQIFRSALSELGGGLVDKVFKWGLGPYLDGLFAQSGFGIVTSMTIALSPRPESTMAFFFGLANDEHFEEGVERVRATLRRLGGVVGSINMMNRRRVLSMMVPYPRAQTPSGQIVSEALLSDLGRRHQVMPWTCAGALYGPQSIVSAAKREVARALRPLAKRLVFLTQERLRLPKAVVNYVPGLANSRVGNVVTTLDKTLKLLNGMPSDIALPLAYWKTPNLKPQDGMMDPARDGCGLIWYSPLVPMTAALARNFVNMTEAVCVKHGIEPLITLTSLSDRCFDSTVPILFDQSDADEVARAHACYHELLVTGCSQGSVPYRAGIESMDFMVRQDTPYWTLANKLKRTLDADNLFSPGRYS